MERNIGENDSVIQQMARYKFDSRIKVSYIFEDCEEIDANITEKLLSDDSGRNTAAETESLLTPSNDIHNSLASFNHMQQSPIDRMNQLVNPNENEPPTSNAVNNHTIHPPSGNSYLTPNACISLQKEPINEFTYPVNSSTLNPKMTIINLLDTVSENMISITKYYYRYRTDFLRTRGKTDARKWYLTYKHHYFNLSYSVSVSLFLPHENNQAFIIKFIARTIELANSKSWFNISFDNLKQLVSDMIQWTKQKKKYLEASTNHIQRPMYTTPESNYISNLNPGMRNNTDDSICLFSTGPPNKEMRITFDPTTLINKSGVHSKDSNTVQTSKRSCNVLYDNMIVKRQKSQNNNSYTSNQIKSPTNNPPPYNSQNSQFHQTSNVYKNITHSNNLNLVSPGAGQNKYCENIEQPLVSRSLSRDSGFGSPVLSLNDTSIGEDIPVNDGALSFPNGPCKVCNTSTKKMCVGCYQVYYCTSKCQKVDWAVHMHQCYSS